MKRGVGKIKRLFFSEVRVLYADTDAMGVAYHTNYIRWFEIGRTELLREIGFPYSEFEKYPVWMPLAQAYCEYKQPAHYDDLVEIVSYISEMGHASLILNYEIRRKPTGELLVSGYTRHGFTDDKLKPIALKKVYPELYAALKAIAADEEFKGRKGKRA